MKRLALFLIMFLAFSSAAMAEGSGSSAAPSVLLFYENACASCDIDKQLYREIYETPGIQTFRGDYRIVPYNLFHGVQSQYLLRVLESLGVERRDISIPCVVAGGRVISRGDWGDQLPAALEAEIGAPSEYPDFHAMIAEINAAKSEELAPTESVDTVYYFYVPLCADCTRAKAEIDAFAQAFEDYRIVSLDISQEENLQLFRRYAQAFEISEADTAVPIVFYSGGYLPNAMITYENLEGARDQIKGEIAE